MELRQLARRRRTYVLRFVYLGLLLAVMALAAGSVAPSRGVVQSLVAQAQTRAELGHDFLAVFAVFSVIAMQLLGPVLTSTAVGNERLRRTLDALLMTPLTAWQIVGGKLFSRTLTAFSLIGLTLPVLAIVRLLGGVEWQDLLGAVVLAAATAIGSAAIGLLLSCYLRRAFAVILIAFLIEGAIYFFLPMIFSLLYSAAGGWRGGGSSSSFVMQAMAAMNPMMTAVLNVFRSGIAPASWWPAVAVQAGMAALLMLAATRAIRREARTVRPAPTPAGGFRLTVGPPPLPEIAADSPGTAPSRPRATVRDNPVLWREIRRPMLARPWQRVVATTLVLLVLFLSYIAFAGVNAIADRDIQIGYAFAMTTLLLLIVVVLSATAIATEKESDTWTTLIASPLSGRSIVWGKFRGVLRRLRWPLILIGVHFALFTVGGVIDVRALIVILLTSTIFLMPWVATGLYFSLRCARPTTAVVLNLLMPLIAYILAPMALYAVDSLHEPIDRADWSEAVMYYLPYYYENIAIERLSAMGNHGVETFRLPISGKTFPIDSLLPLTLFVGGLLLAVTAALLAITVRRFDRIVGRASGSLSRVSTGKG